MKAPEAATIRCPACGVELSIPFTVTFGSDEDGRPVMNVEGDAARVRAHVETHRGPEGGPGQPLPAPVAA